MQDYNIMINATVEIIMENTEKVKANQNVIHRVMLMTHKCAEVFLETVFILLVRKKLILKLIKKIQLIVFIQDVLLNKKFIGIQKYQRVYKQLNNVSSCVLKNKDPLLVYSFMGNVIVVIAMVNMEKQQVQIANIIVL